MRTISRYAARLAPAIGAAAMLAACATPEELDAYEEEQATAEERARERIAAALESGACRYRQQTGFRTRKVLQCEPGVLRPRDATGAEAEIRDWQNSGAVGSNLPGG
ncbi:hypothetical protein [Marinicauda salina]|uniref:hypothetical protein n=1 Tax=Marinicauda salina TaxID=2135793 RepID=UPI001305066A|nr:hypothetical protein [Marinicauda salina]